MHAPLIVAQGLVVRDETGGNAQLVAADEIRLRQILLNVLSNAVKYNRPGGHIVLTVSRTPDAVRLSVRDTGPGMSASEVEQLFTPFERLGAAGRGINGTGLGLVVSRQLLHAMHGHLEVDSRLDVGTTFTIALPAAGHDHGSC